MARRERPLDPGDSPLLRFAADLRALRERAGSPTYRRLALLAHSSAASLSVAAGGRRFPTLAVTSAYVRACGGDVGEWEDRWHAVAAALARRRPPPYAGPAAYTAADGDRYFGRERLVDEALERLRRDRIVVVAGASGAGTTSLLQAGLAHRLAASGHPPAVGAFVPGPDPAAELARCLARLPGPDAVLVVDRPERLHPQGPAVTGSTHSDGSPSLHRLLDALLAAPCRLALGLRTDLHDRVADHPLLARATLTVPPPTPEELTRVVTEPAAAAGCTVEDRLLAVLVAGAHRHPGGLALLSAALLATWRNRDGNRLTLDGFRAAGGFEGAVTEGAEAVWAELADGPRRRAREILLRLTEPGDDGEPRALHRRELGDDPGTAAVLERLAAARVVTLDHDRAVLAHTAVLQGWPRLAAWTAEDPDALDRARRLARAARAWEESGRDPAALWRGWRAAGL
ncbi:nSTAND1 domain-containing NTPase, partial [Streptomyces sp. URMC 126]|uniref:nSTAND1 domain-containing NTPase n=1 Tax=Streptomyces sp. URMC 126 TaxID=3423401 RepID=UPI003F1C9A7C